ncbi:MAG: hypothetical protein ACYDAR_18145 [Thermomicrobiales bacterium]
METTYQLWDNASGNLIEDYDTEREALDYVIEEIETYGPDAVHMWALLRDPGTGPVMMIAQGKGLIRHATESINARVAPIPHD